MDFCEFGDIVPRGERGMAVASGGNDFWGKRGSSAKPSAIQQVTSALCLLALAALVIWAINRAVRFFDDQPIASKPAAMSQADKQKDAAQVWNSLTAATKDCDDRVEALGTRNGESAVDTYERVSDASSACTTAAQAISELPIPDRIHSAAADKFDGFREDCHQAYLIRSVALDRMNAMINGDVTVKSVAEARQAARMSSMAGVECSTKLFAALGAAGVDMAEFSKSPAVAATPAP